MSTDIGKSLSADSVSMMHRNTSYTGKEREREILKWIMFVHKMFVHHTDLAITEKKEVCFTFPLPIFKSFLCFFEK